jgi:hypothetical protein
MQGADFSSGFCRDKWEDIMTAPKSDTLSRLHECCTYRVPALILDPYSDSIWHARLETVSLETVTLGLFEETHNFLKSPRYYISFTHNGLCCAFSAKVLGYQSNTPPSFSSLTLELPGKIIDMERRMSHRIPIGEKRAPSVRLYTTENRSLRPKPKDLSLTGMMIEFDPADNPDLPPETEVGLELSFNNYAVRLQSVIKNRDGNDYFLFFTDVITEHGINAPEPLRNIVESLERAWFEERIHPDKQEIRKFNSPLSQDPASKSIGKSCPGTD